MSNEPRYPDLNEKSLAEQVAELKDYIVNLHRYIRYADNNIAERNLTRTLEDKINSYVDADGVVHILDELGFDSEVGFYNYVTFHNLQTEGETIINGDNITTGTVLADYIDVDGLISANNIIVSSDLTDGSTIISGDNILTGTIDADYLNVNDIISTGNIIVTSNLTDGTTQISGDNITTGTIDAARLNVGDIISTGSIIVAGDDISDLNNDTGFITSNDIPTDLSDFNNDTGFITDAVDSVILVYKSAASGTSTMAKPNAEVTDTTGSQNTWTTVRPQYSSSYPVLFVCWQTKLVSGTVSWTTPAKDETTTVIDGGHITTGTIDASQVTVTNIDADNINTGTLDADRIKSSHDYGSQYGIVEATFNDSNLEFNVTNNGTTTNVAQISYDPLLNQTDIGSYNHYIGIVGNGLTISSQNGVIDILAPISLKINNKTLNDFVVEEDIGHNGSWNYRWWNSGKLECWGRFSFTASAISSSSGSLYTTSAASVFSAYPKNGFDAVPTTTMSVEGDQGLWLAAVADSNGNTASKTKPNPFKVMKTTSRSASTTFYVNVYAIGYKAHS